MPYPLGTGTASGVVATQNPIQQTVSGVTMTRTNSNNLNPNYIFTNQNRASDVLISNPIVDVLSKITATKVWNSPGINDLYPEQSRSGVVSKIDLQPIVNKFTLAEGIVTLRSFTGAATPSGVVRNIVNKSIAGSLSSSGTVTRTTTHTFTGAITPSSSVTKSVSRLLDGVITPSSSETNLMIRELLVNGSVSPNSYITTKTTFHLVGAVSLSGEVLKSVSTDMNGGIEPTSGLTMSAGGVSALSAGGLLSTTGHVAFLVFRDFSGSMNPSGVDHDTGKITETGLLSPTGSDLLLTLKSLTGSVTPSGVERIILSRILNSFIVPQGNYHSKFIKSLNGSVASSATEINRPLLLKVGTIAPTGTVVLSAFVIFSSIPGFVYSDAIPV